MSESTRNQDRKQFLRELIRMTDEYQLSWKVQQSQERLIFLAKTNTASVEVWMEPSKIINRNYDYQLRVTTNSSFKADEYTGGRFVSGCLPKSSILSRADLFNDADLDIQNLAAQVLRLMDTAS